MAKCRSEADRYFPLETGGALMGYRMENEVFVTKVISAGPHAMRNSHSFEPDYAWQNDRIAEHYEQSGRRETYLGDWHSHPAAASGKLSHHDRAVIRKIIRTPSARAPAPLMIIFFGVCEHWDVAVWSGQFVIGWFGRSKFSITQLPIHHD
jgi:integrative and conjugative element protein (TIGR02256 family)